MSVLIDFSIFAEGSCGCFPVKADEVFIDIGVAIYSASLDLYFAIYSVKVLFGLCLSTKKKIGLNIVLGLGFV